MKVSNLVKSLNRYGIEAAEYRKPPAGPEVFAITILNRKDHGHRKGVVTLNQGQAKVEVFGSRKHRQASVTVRENERKVTRLVKWRTVRDTKPDEETITERLKAHFPITMPAETVWSVSDIVVTSSRKKTAMYGRSAYGDPEWKCTGKVTATVPNKSTNHFLIGMDETHHFIAPLPKQATSVRAAHKLLRGKVKPGTTRQGEWFFVPVDKKTAQDLSHIASTQATRVRPMRLGDSTHTAKSAIDIGGKTYARGYITDSRDGHHRAIFLPKWREVRHNEETEMQISPAQAEAVAANRRRARTWD